MAGVINFSFVRHTFLVVTVKRWLKSVCIYGSYHKIKTGVPRFGPPCTTLCDQFCLNGAHLHKHKIFYWDHRSYCTSSGWLLNNDRRSQKTYSESDSIAHCDTRLPTSIDRRFNRTVARPHTTTGLFGVKCGRSEARNEGNWEKLLAGVRRVTATAANRSIEFQWRSRRRFGQRV